ncbi:hypothetical protein CYLTODRAFT_494699 [Cylindrobasidium torrendii FP15055 ss-10]|uniref:Uncharacterized protein n=1 Tax=Cylindrobasidium torrendii FP15055 ss-10 TaxID=1314674 RepID=A0A0D7AVX5_9AGAR|nr:hypothetical protein CYLTODRAFT_494699 [Cylindrobasidium torrendii FP15055 ss-10]
MPAERNTATAAAPTWAHTLSRQMRPHIRDAIPHCPKRRPVPSPIWQRAVVQAVASDITAGRQGRRFIRINDLGIGGIAFYEIDGTLRWGDVFGEENGSGKEGGMCVDELMERISVEVNYAPLYACTSFVTGQIMNAVLHDSALRPEPTENGHGFSVPFKPLPNDSSEPASPIASTFSVDDDLFDDDKPSLMLDDGDSVYSLAPLTPDRPMLALDRTSCPNSPTCGPQPDSVLGALLLDFESESVLVE